MDRISLLSHRASPCQRADAWLTWLAFALVLGAVVAVVVTAVAVADVAQVAPPDLLLGPIRWDWLPRGMA
jgi:hypothetical protein